ncbi:MAG: hypothetical protein L6R41_003396, partial [Letrouitia leprolyta]
LSLLLLKTKTTSHRNAVFKKSPGLSFENISSLQTWRHLTSKPWSILLPSAVDTIALDQNAPNGLTRRRHARGTEHWNALTADIVCARFVEVQYILQIKIVRKTSD